MTSSATSAYRPAPGHWAWTHLVLGAVGPCLICAAPTRFAQGDFQCHLHPGECTEAMWRQYDAAEQAAGPITPFEPLDP